MFTRALPDGANPYTHTYFLYIQKNLSVHRECVNYNVIIIFRRPYVNGTVRRYEKRNRKRNSKLRWMPGGTTRWKWQECLYLVKWVTPLPPCAVHKVTRTDNSDGGEKIQKRKWLVSNSRHHYDAASTEEVMYQMTIHRVLKMKVCWVHRTYGVIIIGKLSKLTVSM